MSKIKNFINSIKTKFTFKNKNIIIYFCIGLLCIVAIIISNKFTNKKNITTSNSSSSYSFSSLQYANEVADNLQQVINSVKGVSNAKVVVVVDQSPTISYLTETKQDGSAVVYVKQGSSYQPVIVTEFAPKIVGILVVAKGTKELSIKHTLLNAISAVYNVDVSKIDILEGD